VTGVCEYCSELSGSIKGGEFLGQLSFSFSISTLPAKKVITRSEQMKVMLASPGSGLGVHCAAEKCTRPVHIFAFVILIAKSVRGRRGRRSERDGHRDIVELLKQLFLCSLCPCLPHVQCYVGWGSTLSVPHRTDSHPPAN
jgi:hypothetical protein